MEDLTEAGQIKNGATIVLANDGAGEAYESIEVLNAGTDHEEILLEAKGNLYFITSMAIDGSSWAKDVKFHNPTI